jgi:hypothetical protein
MTQLGNTVFDLALLEEFGNEMSGGRGFEAMFAKFNGETGEWKAGKNATSMNQKRLVADVPDVMKGWQCFKDRKPFYALVRVNDGIAPPRRRDLGDTDERLWDRKEGDPWKYVGALPFFDPESRETFIFITSTVGGTKAIGWLVNAYAAEQRRNPGKLPLVELESDSYLNKRGGRTFVPVFDIVGWVDRPAAVKRTLPPPLPQLSLEGVRTITAKSDVSPNTKMIEHNGGGNEPPPYSDAELSRLMRESEERAGDLDEAQF